MNPVFSIAVEADVTPADLDAVIAGLTNDNPFVAHGDTPRFLLVTLRDAAGRVVGGLVGAFHLSWLQVHAVWVPDAMRGQGWGQALVDKAEQEALRQECRRVFLETLSLQALPFYEKLGYRVIRRPDLVAAGDARYGLTKMLAATAVC